MTGLNQQERLSELGRLIRLARSAVGLSVTDAADRAEISRSQWTKFEAGEARSPRTQTLGRIERSLGWPPGSINRYLEGGEEPGDAGVQQVLTFSAPGARERLLADLRRELTLDEQGELARQLLQAIVDAQTWHDAHRPPSR